MRIVPHIAALFLTVLVIGGAYVSVQGVTEPRPSQERVVYVQHYPNSPLPIVCQIIDGARFSEQIPCDKTKPPIIQKW